MAPPAHRGLGLILELQSDGSFQQTSRDADDYSVMTVEYDILIGWNMLVRAHASAIARELSMVGTRRLPTL